MKHGVSKRKKMHKHTMRKFVTARKLVQLLVKRDIAVNGAWYV